MVIIGILYTLYVFQNTFSLFELLINIFSIFLYADKKYSLGKIG